MDLLYDGKTENSLMFLNADHEIQNEDFQLSELSLDEPIHSEASLTSKPLPLLPPLQDINFTLGNIDWNNL